MLLKTHLAIALLFAVIFINYASDKAVFIIMMAIATLLPNIDNPFSGIGKNFIFKPVQFFTKHRGMFHSFTLAIILSILLAIFVPVASFGFFLGYSIHLMIDSFTREGIQPFWPSKMISRGFIPAGGRVEDSIFLFFVVIDILLFAVIFVFV